MRHKPTAREFDLRIAELQRCLDDENDDTGGLQQFLDEHHQWELEQEQQNENER